jgi:hypothetical protein
MKKLKQFIVDECRSRTIYHNNPHKIACNWHGVEMVFHYSPETGAIIEDILDEVGTVMASIPHKNEIMAIEAMILMKCYLSYPVSDKNMHYVPAISLCRHPTKTI